MGNCIQIYLFLSHGPNLTRYFDSAYFGNQQFTSSQLVFVNCNTALQVHWDWAWTMQDYVIESCTNGLTIVGGVRNKPVSDPLFEKKG